MQSENSPKAEKRTLSWGVCLYGSLVLLPMVILFNFYGLYTDRFYFFKIDNYILPLVAILHLVYLYAMRFKIREGEFADMQMRNVEFGMYAVLAIYFFKCMDTLWTLWGSQRFSAELIPDSFFSTGYAILALQVSLVLFTFWSFFLRRRLIGSYDMEQIKKNLDSLG